MLWYAVEMYDTDAKEWRMVESVRTKWEADRLKVLYESKDLKHDFRVRCCG